MAALGGDSESCPRCIKHAALLNQDIDAVYAGRNLPATHMSPPLELVDDLAAHVAGWLELNEDEAREVGTWISEKLDAVGSVGALRQYIVYPHQRDVVDEHTGRFRYARFSCCGFILEAYRSIGINLVRTDDLPIVPYVLLQELYDFDSESEKALKWVGLTRGEDVPVLLPGYLFHALQRDEEIVRNDPYQPQPGDERFPREQ